MHFLQKFCMCQLFMRFILDNDVRILGIFPCPMHDLPNICRSMVIVQMLVCLAIIIMYMESFDTFAVSGQKAFYIQSVYMGMSDIDQRLRLRDMLEDPEILLIAEEMHAMLLPAQIFDHEIHLHLRCHIRHFFS